MDARVLGLFIAPSAAEPMSEVQSVFAWAGKGLDGDRYANKTGTYSDHPGSGRDVTLIEMESLEALERDYQVTLNPQFTRRNVLTRGIALNHFIGKKLQVGGAVLLGARLCEPCMHLERLSVKGTMRALIHRGGLRAEVLEGGLIKVGDTLAVQ